MYHRKPLAVCMILLNLAAIACLIYLAVPYLMHDTYVARAAKSRHIGKRCAVDRILPFLIDCCHFSALHPGSLLSDCPRTGKGDIHCHIPPPAVV